MYSSCEERQLGYKKLDFLLIFVAVVSVSAWSYYSGMLGNLDRAALFSVLGKGWGIIKKPPIFLI